MHWYNGRMAGSDAHGGIADPNHSQFLGEVREATEFAGVALRGAWFDQLLAEALSSSTFPLRPLHEAERRELERLGNTAADWSRILVVRHFVSDNIAGNRFCGPCVLGLFGTGTVGQRVPLPAGIYRSTLRNAIVDDGAAVHSCPLVSDYRVCRQAAVSATTLVFDPRGSTAYGNDGAAVVGAETGGREVPLAAELTLAEAALLAEPAGRNGEAAKLAKAVSRYTAAIRPGIGVVGERAAVHAVSLVRNSWIGPASLVEGASLIEEATLLSAPEEQTAVESGAVVRRSVLQQGTTVRDGAVVDCALLLEHSRAERHAKVTNSVVGPNSGIAEGELTASLVGPFVGFHHQALLIAACWPEGRGNVASGANVGSNHTSRRPDQELRPAEGMFFGLGCSVKYPADFRGSPYSLIATGVTTLPQKLDMPFSLICESSVQRPELPSGYLRLIPGWVLRENLYAVWRNRIKFRERNRARRNAIDTEIFRPDIMRRVERACALLEAAPADREILLPADLPDLGRNFVLDADRRAAVEIYHFFLEWARLSELLRAAGEKRIAPRMTREECAWYEGAVARIGEMVKAGREKDFTRGRRIFDDYEQLHGSTEADPVVADAAAWTRSESERARAAAGLLD